VRWTADEMLRRLLPDGAHSVWSDPTGKVVLLEAAYERSWVGQPVHKLEELVGVRVAFVTRFGDATLVSPTAVLQDGDVLHVLAERSDVERIEQMLAAPPQESE
jgi:trk system potassium uptake protein TrkA